jgi:uncharacterized membrane protein
VRLIRFFAGPFFVFAGAMHVIPKAYKRIVPRALPAHDAIVYASGVAEMVGGVGLMSSRRRRAAGWWLIATLIAVFPANINMALHADDFPQVPGGAKTLYARLPVQGVFIAWVLSAMRRDEQDRALAASPQPV